MNEKHLLVNSITLLYRASQLTNMSDDFTGLVRDILSNIKLPEFSTGMSGEAKVIDSLKKTTTTMCNEYNRQNYTLGELLQRVKIDTGDEVELFDAIERGISPELGESEIKKLCLNIYSNLQNHIRDIKISEIIGRASYQIKFNKDKIQDMRRFVTEICNELEPYQGAIAVIEDPAIVTSVNMADLEQVRKVFASVKDMNFNEGILKTGWQCINRMFRGGFRRGEEIVIGALQHSYKTGFSLTLFKQLLLYNKPYMIKKDKKPLMIRISFEDDLNLNMEYLYRNLIENETGVVLEDISNISIDEMSKYVMDKLRSNGYEVEMLRVDPTQWTYRDIINYCLRKEAEGFEIHVLMLDYLAMVPTTGCTIGPMGSDIRDMYRRLRNYCSPRKITLITPHQLSTDAKMMMRDGKSDFVRELVGKGYYDKCKTIDNEVDVEIFIHIEKINGRSYLTIQRGKHRINGVTPLEYHYTVLPFQPKGCILDDLLTADSSSKKLGGGTIGSKDENPFWDL